MGKYIITFEDNSEVEEDGVKYFRCTEVPWSYTSEIMISKLTPYTEPDIEQVRKEAYEQGRRDGKIEKQAEWYMQRILQKPLRR